VLLKNKVDPVVLYSRHPTYSHIDQSDTNLVDDKRKKNIYVKLKKRSCDDQKIAVAMTST
jgi:hypothetical protein